MFLERNLPKYDACEIGNNAFLLRQSKLLLRGFIHQGRRPVLPWLVQVPQHCWSPNSSCIRCHSSRPGTILSSPARWHQLKQVRPQQENHNLPFGRQKGVIFLRKRERYFSDSVFIFYAFMLTCWRCCVAAKVLAAKRKWWVYQVAPCSFTPNYDLKSYCLVCDVKRRLLF